MKSLFYSWVIFQIWVGIWLFFSPFIFGVTEFHVATNNMLFGALVVILGIGMIFYEYYHRERVEKGSFLQGLFYPWVASQLLIGAWLFISPFMLGFTATRLAISDMLFGTVVVALGIGTFFFELYHREEYETLEHATQRV
jgi:hypothetical protein